MGARALASLSWVLLGNSRLYLYRTVLASLQDATVSSPVNRWSFPLQPWNDPPASLCQPSGLGLPFI